MKSVFVVDKPILKNTSNVVDGIKYGVLVDFYGGKIEGS